MTTSQIIWAVIDFFFTALNIHNGLKTENKLLQLLSYLTAGVMFTLGILQLFGKLD